jgi:hypothetical protein
MPDLNFPSFAGGEIAPAYYGRTDQESYFVSAKSLYNTIASQTGPGIGRGGTVFVATTKGGGKVLLLPFQFNEEQAYVVELGDHYGRIYRNRGQVLEDAISITGITQANPAVVTANHMLTKGKTIRIAGVTGMTQVNNRYFLVDHVLAASKNITDLDRSSPVRMTLAGSHGFVGGETVFIESVGGMTEVNDRSFNLIPITSRIVSITGATAANPVVITTPGAHGLVDGDTVLIEDVGGMTQINNRRFVISPVFSATKTINAITKANPGVVTCTTNHGFAHGDVVLIASVGGMTQVNNIQFTISRVYASTNQLNSANEGLFFGAGTDPVTIISQSHGLSNGQIVYCTGFGYSVELNGREFTVGNASSDTFDLIGSDSSTITRPPAGAGAFWSKGGYSDPTGFVNRVDLTKFSIGVDTTAYTTYTSGGTASKLEASKFSLDSEDGTAHTAYTSGGLASKVIVNDFYLEDENGITHTAYTSGGTVKAVSRTSLKLQTLAGANVDSTGYTAHSGATGTLAAIHEFVTPYAVADLYDAEGIPLIQYAQSADFLFLAHPDYPPHQITREGHADWNCTEFINEEGPFLDENLSDTTIYVETGGVLSAGGVVTLTASDPLWSADHVGAMWEVRLKDNATSPVWVTGTAFTLGAEILSNDLFYRCTDAGTSGTEAPTHDIGEAYDGADTAASCRWKYIHNGRGIVIITGYVSATSVTATVIAELPAGCVGAANATGRWKEGAWSNVQGYPRAVAIHESRLVWGGTAQEPLAMDFSNTESLFYYNPIELDGTVVRSSAFRRVLDGDNPIRWMKSTEKGLIIGTLGGEWVVATEGVTQGFGPDTAVARQFSANGAAAIQPIRNGDSLLYPQRARRRLRDITFSIDQQKLVTSDRNLRADHIALPGITNTVYAEEPHRVTWNLLADGTLAGLTYNREPGAQVSAWHKHVIGGSFGDGDAIVESITVIPGADETTDDVWVVVKRTIDGGTVRYVEWISRPLDYGEDIEDSVYMDSAISYEGSPVTNVTGLDHLEGETVDVLADGIYYTREVEGGTFTEALPVASSRIHVGLYVWRYIETVYLESSPNDSLNTKAQTKRVRAVQIEVIESTKAWCGTGEDDMDQMVFDEFYTGDCPRRYTGFVEETISDDYGRRKFVRIEQREPYPFFVTSITARFEVSNE